MTQSMMLLLPGLDKLMQQAPETVVLARCKSRLKRSKKHLSGQSFAGLLSESIFEQAMPFPFAQCLYAGIQDNYGYLLSPCHFKSDLHTLHLLGHLGESLQAEESLALVNDCNALLEPEGLAIVRNDKAHWLLISKIPLNIESTPLYEAIGSDLGQSQLKGPDSGRMQRILMELQMHLFQHPVNQARQSEGLPEVNGFWLWGEGSGDEGLPESGASVYFDDFNEGITGPNQIALDDLLKQSFIPHEASGRVVIASLELLLCLKQGTVAEVTDTLDFWLAKVLEPALLAVDQGAIECITLLTDAETMALCTYTSRSKWYFWRR